MKLHTLLPAASLLLMACAGPTGPVERRVSLHVSEPAVSRGESVELRLINDSDGGVSYNLCYAVLERRAHRAWHSAERGRNCYTVGFTLAPGSEATGEREIGQEVRSGEYRFRLQVGRESTRELVLITSDAFTVR